MRFMLRAKDADEARKTDAKKFVQAPPSESPSSSAAAPAAAFLRGAGRLLAVADDLTTADRGLATAVTDTGFCVAGRRSWLGANKGVEKFARAAYADACNAPDLSDAAMAATLTCGKAAAGKRSRDSGGPGGSRDLNSRQKGLVIIDGRGSDGKPRSAADSDESNTDEAVRAAVAQTAVRRPRDDNDADESEFAALPFVRPKKS
jgi:hypothetical protein